jgi:hypothetical protein
MVNLKIPEEEFKLLLTLCAHDFRHDFMNTSMRVHTGIFEGVKKITGGGNKNLKQAKQTKKTKQTKQTKETKQTKKTKQTNKTKQTKQTKKTKLKSNQVSINKLINKLIKYIKSLKNSNMTRLAIVINDHIFLKNLNNQKVKNKRGLDKAKSIKLAMENTIKEFNLTISVINKLNNGIIKVNKFNKVNKIIKVNKFNKVNKIIKVNKKISGENNILIPEVGAIKKTKRRSKKHKSKKHKSKKQIKRGGSNSDDREDLTIYPTFDPFEGEPKEEEYNALDEENRRQEEERIKLYFGLDILNDPNIEEDIEKITEMTYPNGFIYDEIPEDEGILIDRIEQSFDSYQDMEDYYNNLDLSDYISSFVVNSDDSSGELVRELNQVSEETTLRRSVRARKSTYYGDDVDISVYEDWNDKFEIYSSLYDVDSANAIIVEKTGEERLMIKTSNDFNDLREFSAYYTFLTKYFGKSRLNFNGYIQQLHSNVSSVINLAVAHKVSSSALKSIKEFGNKVSKFWYTFITSLAPRSVSPAVSPPSKPSLDTITPEGKLLGKMLRLTHDCKSTDATVFKLFTNYFTDYFKTLGINVNMKYPDWIISSKEGIVINNASQLPKHKDIFGEINEGECWAPCVIDAMSNCPRLKPGYTDNIDIHVGSGANYIDYHIHNITVTSCDMSFLITNNGKKISIDPIRIYYNDKTLSVVNIIKQLMDKVNIAISGGIGGATLEEKVARFNSKMAGQVLELIVLPIVCMKLFGDLGQELLSIAKYINFASNDRPSAARFILLKKIFNDNSYGGGYFPNDIANRFYF